MVVDEAQPWAPRYLGYLMFASRWLQAPLYVGLVVAQCVYVYKFWVELVNLVSGAYTGWLSMTSPEGVVSEVRINETVVMLAVLGLIDVVMIANLLIMIIIGGYETFVSRIMLSDHRDRPEWLSHVNANVLKVKLAMAIIGISSIHLLRTFIQAKSYDAKTLIAQTSIHMAFIVSALALAWIDRIMNSTAAPK